MKITKFEQSCLRIEKSGSSLLVDVGSLTTSAGPISRLGKYDAVLYTHAHSDHFDVQALEELAANGATLYGNADVAAAAAARIEVIEDDEELVVAGFKIKAAQLNHCLMPDGTVAGIDNTGFLIDDRLLVPGDSTETAGLKAAAVALPVFGPDISFKDAFAMVIGLGVSDIIPVHYDLVGMNREAFESFHATYGAPGRVHSLGIGQSVTI